LGIKGMVAVELCSKVPLIQIVNSGVEYSISGLRSPQHMAELGWEWLEWGVKGDIWVRMSIKVNSDRGVSCMYEALGFSTR
jgi:hypothetical protein